MKPVKDIEISYNVNELVRQLKESGGFTAKKLAVGVDVLESMLKDKDCLKFLSFPACIIATGTRGVIKELVKHKYADVVITTCGTLDHDIARAYKDYYHGSFMMDDAELREKKMNRLGNILVPNDSYGSILEQKMSEFLKDIYEQKKELSTYELCSEIGKRVKNEDSILHWCYKNEIPMIVPGITDGSVGYQIWQFAQDHKIKIDLLKDEQLMSDLVWDAKRSGALILGGGISKHHVLWWNQFKQGGLDYAVYISTAIESDGSLSGARPREAVSWGKINKDAKFVNVEADATIALPIIVSALKERLQK